MPIPFRDRTDDAPLGLAGFLKFEDEPNGKGMRAALFLVNSLGEPVDFSFSRVDMRSSFLWRAGEARRHAVAALARALFSAAPCEPALLLALAGEVPSAVFAEDLEVRIPLCRIATTSGGAYGAGEAPEQLGEAMHLFWVPAAPPAESSARGLLNTLHGRRLVTEPFERAALGLLEAFAEP